MFTKSKKLIFTMIAIILVLTLFSSAAFAVYEDHQYIDVMRSLDPNTLSPELGSQQTINYLLSGDEFSLDPSAINPSVQAEKDIALVLDISGSMTASLGGKTRLAVLKESAIDFINRFAGTNTKICIIAFHSHANDTTELLSMQNPSDVTALINKVNSLTTTGSTNTGDAMRRAYWKLKNAPANPFGNKKYMILLTDGEANYATYTTTARTELKYDDGNAQYYTTASTSVATNYAAAVGTMLKNDNITSLFIGLTTSSVASLQTTAVAAGAPPVANGLNYYRVTSAAELTSVYNQFADEIASTFPISVNFQQVFPAGVQVISIPSGCTSTNRPDGSTLVTGTINVALNKNPSGKYSITPWNSNITVKYNEIGSYNLDDLSFSYVDPFSNPKTATISNIGYITVIDSTPPSIPQGLYVDQNLGNSVSIGWLESTDLSSFITYEVYRDGELIGETTSPFFTDTGVNQGQLYEYTVIARDSSNNRSEASEKLQVVTLDIDPPSVPTNLSYVPGSGSAHITWDPSVDNVQLAGYKVYKDGVYLTTVTSNEYTATDLLSGVYYLFSVSAVDASGNESAKAEISVKANTPPIASAGPDQTVEGVNSNGAFVTLDASDSSDPENDPLTYTWTGSFGTLSGKIISVELPLGTHTITLTVSDGEYETTDEVVVNIVDTTAPIITGAPTTPSNANGWYNGDVTVHFSAEDEVSGIKYITPDVLITDEGANQSVTGTAKDNAGNTASVTVSNINIDKTKPTITGSIPDPNEYGWYSYDVTVQFAASDDLSGIESVTSPITLSTDGANQSVTGTAIDKAGNTESTVVSGINVDKTAPVIMLNSFQTGTFETNKSEIFQYSVVETLSGVLSESAYLNGTPITNGQVINMQSLAGINTITITVTDMAGNTSTITHTFETAISAKVDISPKDLNLNSKGGENSVTVRIELLNGFTAGDIDDTSVWVIANGVAIETENNSGPKDKTKPKSAPNHLNLKLNRDDLISALINNTGEVPVVVTGKLSDDKTFYGIAIINVKNNKKK